MHSKTGSFLFSFTTLAASIIMFISCHRAAAPAQANPKTGPVIENGEAQIIPEFKNRNDWIRHDLWVETEFDTDGDGRPDRMHVGVTRPRQTDSEDLKLPVIYITSPYFAGIASTDKKYFWNVEHELGEEPPARIHPPGIRVNENDLRPVISDSEISTWVPRGFVVVHSTSPGTGLSDGVPTVGGENESLAPKAVIDWLCGRAKGYTSRDGNEEVEAYWSSGKVGMTGTSYNGTLPLAAATTGVEGLKAIIPVAPNTSYYHYYRSHGLVRHPGGYLGEDIDVLYDIIHSGDESKRPYADSLIRDIEIAQGMDRVTGDYNEFWKKRDYLNHLDKMKAALLMSHGFNDWNVMPEHSLRIYEAVKEKGIPAKIFYHQGGHGGPPPLWLMNRWFTRFLLDVKNGIEEPPHAYIVREGDDRTQPTAYEDYPHPAAENVVFYPGKGGTSTGTLTREEPSSQGSEVLTDDVQWSGTALAKAEESPHRLLYLTAPLDEPLHISGRPQLRIRMSSDKPAANLSVWLVSLPWNDQQGASINDNLITRGWADPQNHRSLWESEPLEPGKFYEWSFDLQPDDQIIPPGQQIGLMIFSSDQDFTLWPEAGTKITVDLEKTNLTLPVVGGNEPWKKR